MLLVQKVGSWIRDRFTLYHVIIAVFQLFGAFVMAIASPFLLRHLFLPSLVEYTIPLHFNFETCREQLAGICSFPTAVVDLSVENPKLSPKEYYEISVEIILSESTITANVGIFQAVIELVDQLNMKRTFRRSCFANKHHSVMYRIAQAWWNLVCRTLLFPAYFFGLLTALDDHKLEVSFTNRLVDSDLANTALLYVQLQNRFIEVFLNEDVKDSFIEYDLGNKEFILPNFAYQNLFKDFTLNELERSEITEDATFFIWHDLRSCYDKTSGSSLHLRQQSKQAKQ
uniref:Seipin n=1 Tax=Elaeophora elaphi TaxID=1147741 RepID=A0A0R3S448_9BILA